MEEADRENLERAAGMDAEKATWEKALDDEAEAKADMEALPEAQERISQTLKQAEENLKNLEFSLESYGTKWAQKLWAWASDKKDWKSVVAYRTQKHQLEGLIKDCQDALAVIEMRRKYPPLAILRRGDHARDEIRQRMPHE